jgi:hypothetical protein
MSDMNWRDKDDLDLTSEDIDAMVAEGQPVVVRGPRMPAGASLVTPSPTLGGSVTSHPQVPRPAGRLVGASRSSL